MGCLGPELAPSKSVGAHAPRASRGLDLMGALLMNLLGARIGRK